MAIHMARITCPNCRRQFSAPVEQILDVEVDPLARSRLLSGQLNFVGCPHCGMGGGLDLPFLYYDPSKELALVYMPMEAGHNDMERQQLIGSLSRRLLNQLPREQRKGYLLNPQVFFSIESLVNRVLEAEGITPEIIEEQKAKAGLLMRLLETETAEERSALIGENIALIDPAFFAMLQASISQADMIGRQDIVQRMIALMEQLIQETQVGRELAARSEAVRALEQEPTREKLLELLVGSSDPLTRAALIGMGQNLVDYRFFQMITQRIEGAQDRAERARLEALRQELLDAREQLRQQMEAVVEERAKLLRNLLTTEQPELLARRHLDELDDIFFDLLGQAIEHSQEEGTAKEVEAYRKIWDLTTGLIRERIPPELLLLNEIAQASDREAIRQVLENNRQLVTPSLVEVLEQASQQLQEGGQQQAAGQLNMAAEMAREMMGSQQAAPPQPPSQKEDGGESSSGLLIARR